MQTSNQKPAIILIHEIYGINGHMKSIINHFERAGFDVYCPHLLGEVKSFNYVSEDEAYQHFMNEVGFERALEDVLRMANHLKKRCTNIFVLGFSVGATVAWLCSHYGHLFTGIIGFYGSRIRDYLDITPKCKTLLFFPTIETSFDPQDVLGVLEKKNKLQVIMIEGKHGFTNQYSTAFDAVSKSHCFHQTYDFIMTHSKLKNDRTVGRK
ncbi:dienelactone hydrolase family protein [Bacillus sp. NPDC077027]|uniref:dienelactone hydrolase family protein n=1 Tax=Bacillus sp. NPDC077027 TaxID=3390548 RepID=UPI003CFCFA82